MQKIVWVLYITILMQILKKVSIKPPGGETTETDIKKMIGCNVSISPTGGVAGGLYPGKR